MQRLSPITPRAKKAGDDSLKTRPSPIKTRAQVEAERVAKELERLRIEENNRQMMQEKSILAQYKKERKEAKQIAIVQAKAVREKVKAFHREMERIQRPETENLPVQRVWRNPNPYQQK